MVASSQIKTDGLEQLHLEALPSVTKKVFLRCVAMPFFSSGHWYLAGGTALALHAGHRQSVDLDFFTTEKFFDEKKIEQALSVAGKWKTSSMDYGTVYGEFGGAKMSLIAYPFFRPTLPLIKIGQVSIVTLPDIAVMKIVAISQRGKKRDFVDLYWLCLHTQSLRESIDRTLKQYTVQQNSTHLLKSLVFFDDAENDPMPELFFKADWRTIKSYFRKEVPKITKELLGLK